MRQAFQKYMVHGVGGLHGLAFWGGIMSTIFSSRR